MAYIRTDVKFENDNSKYVGADNNGKPIKYDYMLTTSANIKPGMPVKYSGNSGCTEAEAADTGLFQIDAIAELDKTQVNNCTVAYAEGDTIPCIPLAENRGLRMRNVMMGDPGSAVSQRARLSADATGFAYHAAYHEASGYYVETMYDISDPNADTRIRAVIL